MRIAICVPTREHVIPWYFAECLMAIIRPPDTLFLREIGKPVDVARNSLVESALKYEDVTHLFFMDADMTFPMHALGRLIRHRQAIVSGTYFARAETPIPHAYRYVRREENGTDLYFPEGEALATWMKAHWNEVRELPDVGCAPEWPDNLRPVDALGAGCLLVERRVFDAIGYPWFVAYHDTGGGEDFDFCRRAKEFGFQPYVDWAVRCGHEMPNQFVTVEDFTGFFGVNTADEHDWEQPFRVEVTPGGWVRRAGKAVLEAVKR